MLTCAECLSRQGECDGSCGKGYAPIKPITNADRIRSMSDEELAVFLLNRSVAIIEKASKAVGFTYKVDRELGLANLIDWLEEEALDEPV